MLRAEPKILLCFCILLLACLFSLAMCMQDLSSLTRDWTFAPAIEAQSPNHWANRKFSCLGFFYTFQYPGCSTGPCLWLAFSKHVWNVIELQSYFCKTDPLPLRMLESRRMSEDFWRQTNQARAEKLTYHAASLPSGLETSSWFLVCYWHIVGHISPIWPQFPTVNEGFGPQSPSPFIF